MLKVSKRSWHYRWLNWVWNDCFEGKETPRWARNSGIVAPVNPSNLCAYCRWILLATSLFVLIGVPVLVGMWLITPIALTIASIKQRYPHREKKVRPPKEPSIFAEWAKAKHDKVCPFIEFVE